MTVHDDAARLAALEGQYNELGEEIRRLRGQIVAATTPGTVVEVGGQPRYRVAPGKRTFDEGLARTVFGPEAIAAATVAKVDGAALKRISPALWELSCKVGEPFLVAVK